MEKIVIKPEDIKVRNPIAQALADNRYGQRIVKNKKVYNRKRPHKED